MQGKRRIRNLGILAHVDAGKATVTEQMLYLSGSTRAVGNVDKGTSLSDTLDVEKKRGISVRASSLAFSWQDVQRLSFAAKPRLPWQPAQTLISPGRP